MKALKHPLTVRDNDGKEWEIEQYIKTKDYGEFIIIDSNSYKLGEDCQWVEAEESVIDSNQMKSCETCIHEKLYGEVHPCILCRDFKYYTPK